MIREEPAVFAIGEAASRWAEHVRAILEPATLRGVSTKLGVLELLGPELDVCLIHADGGDALLTAALVWERAPHVSIVLAGDDVDAATRAAAYEAGVAYVTVGMPAPDELRAVLRMACDQNRAGSPELVRAMCRTMCQLSSLAALASDRTFIDAAVLQIAELFQADIVSVLLLDEVGELRIAAQLGLADAVAKSPRRGEISGAVLRSGEPRIILRAAPTSSADDDAADSAVPARDISASMCVPIAAPGGGATVRGVVNIARASGRSIFTARDLEVASSVARLISEALGGIEARVAAAEAEQRLQAAERLSTLGEISAGIAHEVANPLAVARANVGSLIGYLNELAPLLADLEDSHPQLADILDDLPAVVCETWEGLSRADEVIRQVKGLARADEGTSRDQPIAFAEIVNTVVRFLGARLPRVRTALDPRAMVSGSAVELSQILVNLLVNAADACEERRQSSSDPSYQPQVTVSLAHAAGQVTLTIEDNGAGMSEETRARAFMPLFTTKPGVRGTGLGLSLVRRLVDRHAGTVRVTSAPGAGTGFTVVLPAAGELGSAPTPVELPLAVAEPLERKETPYSIFIPHVRAH